MSRSAIELSRRALFARLQVAIEQMHDAQSRRDERARRVATAIVVETAAELERSADHRIALAVHAYAAMLEQIEREAEAIASALGYAAVSAVCVALETAVERSREALLAPLDDRQVTIRLNETWSAVVPALAPLRDWRGWSPTISPGDHS